MPVKADAVLDFHCPRWNELPALSLYMDQVILVLEETLAIFADEKERIITPAMINNYVKQKIIEPPQKKKYGRSHLAGLIVLSIMKKVLSISEINTLMIRMVEAFGQEAAYGIFSERLEQVLVDFFSARKHEVKKTSRDEKMLDALTAALTALAGKLYFQAYMSAP